MQQALRKVQIEIPGDLGIQERGGAVDQAVRAAVGELGVGTGDEGLAVLDVVTAIVVGEGVGLVERSVRDRCGLVAELNARIQIRIEVRRGGTDTSDYAAARGKPRAASETAGVQADSGGADAGGSGENGRTDVTQ